MKKTWIAAWALLLMLLLPLCAAMAEATDGEAEFYGTIGKKMTVYRDASESAAALGKIEAGTVVDVYKKGRTWTRIGYEGGQGYVLTDTLFTPEGFRYPINVSSGSWLSIHQIKDGRVYFPYRRLENDVSLGVDKMRIYDFVDWSEAEPGDLLYAFTTFYSTSTSKEGNAGRVYNIKLASERLSGIRVKSGESFSFNAVCGPYTKENGYHEAPILSGESSMGYGGGVCQVCSTLYNIVLRVPTVIEDMNWHSQGGTKYLPAGYDATVSNTKDMVFRNILPYDIRLEFESKDGVMTAFMFRDYDE